MGIALSLIESTSSRPASTVTLIFQSWPVVAQIVAGDVSNLVYDPLRRSLFRPRNFTSSPLKLPRSQISPAES